MKISIQTILKSLTFWIIGALVIAVVSAFFLIRVPFQAPDKTAAQREVFVVGTKETKGEIVPRLYQQGLIRSQWAFNLALKRKGKEVEPGGYYLAKSMNAWQVVEVLTSLPSLKWVVIPEGLRKEEIAERLATALSWSQDGKEKWIYTETAMDYDHLEGVYFPDTYLIPVDEGGLEVAQRMINRFNEKFAPYAEIALSENIKWTTAIKLASIIQREAAGKEDMPLIGGILWNRLLTDMKLEVDATVQYARDERDSVTSGFWKPIKPEDKEIDSRYNTYKYKGLPPQPIANPGLDAIEATLNPTETDCLYYLHDPEKQIHCAKTYEEHRQNIKKYL